MRWVHRHCVWEELTQPAPLKTCALTFHQHCAALSVCQISHEAPEKTSSAGEPAEVGRSPSPVAPAEGVGQSTALEVSGSSGLR